MSALEDVRIFDFSNDDDTVADMNNLDTTIQVEAVNTAFYMQNNVLVVKPYKKTPYELFHCKTPTLSFMRPFGCPDTIFNTIDHLGKFDGKADEGIKPSDNAGQAIKETEPIKYYILLPLWTVDLPFSQNPKSSHNDGFKPSRNDGKRVDEDPSKENECKDQEKEDNFNNTNNVNTLSSTNNAACTNEDNELLFDPNMHTLDDVSTFNFSCDDEDNGTMGYMNNFDTIIQDSPVPTTKIHKDHPLDQVIRDLQSAIQTRKISKNLEEYGFVSTIQQRTNHKDLQNCL
nr:ribonuclease H-like domain-containing protein [Tanacetum cinerariifolium]